VNAVNALGLDFGAVDIVYNNPERLATVIEVNSAPGMEAGSTTLFNYVKAFAEKAGLPEVTMEEFNSKYPEQEDIQPYQLIEEFKNNI